jgi:hypothetical protein
MPMIIQKTENDKLIKANDRNFNFFWFGFVLYVLGASFPNLSQASYYFTQSVQLIGILLFVPAAIKLIKWKFDNNYITLIFYFYCLWSSIIILRGVRFNYTFIKQLLLDGGNGIFLYLAPFIMLFPRNIIFMKKVFLVIVTLSFFFLLYDTLFIRQLLWGTPGSTVATGLIETFAGNLALPCGFLLLTFIYHSNRRNIFSVCILFGTFLLASIRARRTLMFMTFTTLFSSYIFYFIANRGKILNVFLSFCLLILLFIFGIEVYSKNSNSLFALITERIDNDTRSGVEKNFYRDMKTRDWIIGKGISGKYYCPGVDQSGTGYSLYRTVIETGYLQIILKGGIISALLIVLILVPAAFNGLFYSNNLLSKAAAVWILLSLLYSYPSTVYDFSMRQLLVWLSAALCFSSDIRQMTDDEIRDQLA